MKTGWYLYYGIEYFDSLNKCSSCDILYTNKVQNKYCLSIKHHYSYTGDRMPFNALLKYMIPVGPALKYLLDKKYPEGLNEKFVF